MQVDAKDLSSAFEFVQKHKPREIIVDKRGWVRIRREIRESNPIQPSPFPQNGRVVDKVLWRELRHIGKFAQLNVMGIPVRLAG